MSDVTRPDEAVALTRDELEAEGGSPLPEKMAMTTISVNFGFPIGNMAMPINLASATNSESPDSFAIADADQVVIVDQIDDDGMEPGPGFHK
jgi:hypothetical protein